MLISFSVENFRSFKDKATLSMEATSGKEKRDTHVFSLVPAGKRSAPLHLLKSAAVYGANASGKSTLFKALAFMVNCVRGRFFNVDRIPVQPFLFNTDTAKQPSLFEIVFLLQGVQYRYGFKADAVRVHEEWLYRAPRGKEALLFRREGKLIALGQDFKEGKGLQEKTRPSALFLTVCHQFNGPIAGEIVQWFLRCDVLSGSDGSLQHFALQRLADSAWRDRLIRLAKTADFAIMDVVIEKAPVDQMSLPPFVRRMMFEAAHAAGHAESVSIAESNADGGAVEIVESASATVQRIMARTAKTFHETFNSAQEQIENRPLPYDEESDGTQQFIGLSAWLLENLERGGVLFVDEFDQHLHPLLVQHLLDLYNRPENKTNAQLIFATHNLDLLQQKSLRRDQFWFTERNRLGASSLYCLSDFPVEEKHSYYRHYILGKVGAIPILERLENNAEAPAEECNEQSVGEVHVQD